MLETIIRIAEAVLEELKKQQQNSPLAVAVIAANTNLQNEKVFADFFIIRNQITQQEESNDWYS